jgi:hypothetical protein
MKAGKWILYLGAIGFLVALPLVWIVAGLAADLYQIHPAAGWLVWVGALVAVLVLCIPVLCFLRLPSLPPREIWDEQSTTVDSGTWRQTARLLIQTSDDPEVARNLQRIFNDLPNSLPVEVRKELARRRDQSVVIRSSTMRQAVLLSLLSPHRQMDLLILLWLNLQQVYRISRCYGFKPSPRGILQLYGSVFGAALLIDALDEAGEQAFAEAAAKLTGSTFLSGAGSLAYEGIRSAAYVGLIGLLTNYLLQHELRKPERSERKAIRRQAWQDALETIKGIGSSDNSQPQASMVQA